MALIIFHLQDSSGQPIGGVIANSVGGPGPWAAMSNPCGDMQTELQPAHYDITFTKPGYMTRILPADLGDCGVVTVGLERDSSALGPQGPSVPRAPLPSFPSPVDYPTSLPFLASSQRDLGFYRGNFCGLHIDGAPVVPGSNAANPSCVMSALLDNYPREIQDAFIARYVADGYTHLQRSLGHALAYGHSVQDYIALSARARAAGIFCDHWFLSGPDQYPGCRDQTVDFWRRIFEPIIPQLLNAGVVDLACVGWQLDQYNQPGNVLIAIIQYLAQALPASIPLYTHWANEALAWWKTGGEVWTDSFTGSTNVMDRFTWWWVMQPYLTGGHHQGSNEMALTDPKQYQDRLLDTLDYFGGDTGKGNMGRSQRNGVSNFNLTAFEVTAQFQFDGQTDERTGDMANYLALCARSHTGWPMSGYGNGASMPNGEAL